MTSDDIRPRGTVEVHCSNGCGWDFWVDSLDPRLPDGPFICPACSGEPILKSNAMVEEK
jgi:hypothetical protein